MARILIIEDDATVARMLVDFLESHGHSVSVAQNGALALQYVDLRRPDAIVLDLMLPIITGVEVAKRLRLDPETRDIPILSITGIDGPDDLADILMVDAVVSKPFSVDAVLQELDRLLDDYSPEEADSSATSQAGAAPGEPVE